MKIYEGYIELSDAHVAWKLNNTNLNYEDSEYLYQQLIDECNENFKKIYGCEFYMLGRSGRHVCVEDTPQNRQRWYRMKSTIERLQKYLISEFNSTKRVF